MNFKQSFAELFSAFHIPSINLPVYSKRDWAQWVQWRIVIDFIAFTMFLWVFYCPTSFLLNNYASSDLTCCVIQAILYLTDMFQAYYSVQTQYMNIVVIILDPILILL